MKASARQPLADNNLVGTDAANCLDASLSEAAVQPNWARRADKRLMAFHQLHVGVTMLDQRMLPKKADVNLKR